MPGWFGRIGAGGAGGVVGGAVFGILMQLTGALPVVANLVDKESVAAGWAVHMGIAVATGLGYALLFGFFAEGLAISAILGVFYGIIWWVLGGLTLMPLRLGLGLFVFDAAAWQSLAGHVAYGLALGLVYAVVCHLLARAQARRPAPATLPGEQPADDAWPLASAPLASGSLAEAAWLPPVDDAWLSPADNARPPPAGSPAPPPFPPLEQPSPATGPRSGLTPLPPHARALRQRGRHHR
jgi:hypothetical protein